MPRLINQTPKRRGLLCFKFDIIPLAQHAILPKQKGAYIIQQAKKGIRPQKKKKKRINIYVLPFKEMAIRESYCFFIHKNQKSI
jgi:hypothetical protein